MDDLPVVGKWIMFKSESGTDSSFESGARMAQGLIYPYSSFPLDLIGPVEIIWKPEAPGDSERTIWLRLHPAIYTQVYTALTNTLSLPNFQQSASTSSVPNPLIQIRDLRSGIDGFEIIGPRAGRVLRRILRLCKSEIKEKHQVSLYTFTLDAV